MWKGMSCGRWSAKDPEHQGWWGTVQGIPRSRRWKYVGKECHDCFFHQLGQRDDRLPLTSKSNQHRQPDRPPERSMNRILRANDVRRTSMVSRCVPSSFLSGPTALAKWDPRHLAKLPGGRAVGIHGKVTSKAFKEVATHLHCSGDSLDADTFFWFSTMWEARLDSCKHFDSNIRRALRQVTPFWHDSAVEGHHFGLLGGHQRGCQGGREED